MSDININGIPNMGFQGGGGGYFYDPFASVNNAVSYNQANLGNQLNNQINSANSQAPTQQQLYGGTGFGSLTAYYSGLGAAYGRATGGFGGKPGRVGTIGNPGTSNPGYLSDASYDPFVAGGAPVQHYGGLGGNQVFDTGRYLEQNPDVWKSGATPWEHYNQFGKQEGRQAPWSDIFDSKTYMQQNPDVAAAGVDPTAHWLEYGMKEGRQGAQTFDARRYLSENRDVFEAGADPWQHYKMFGEKEGRAGSWTDAFNPYAYSQANPDVAASGMDPTAHWYQYGMKEGRQGDWGGGGLSPLGNYQGTGFDAFDPNIYGGSHPTAGFGKQPTAETQQSWEDLWNSRGPYNRSSQSGANNDRDDLAAEYYANNIDVFKAAMASGQDPTTFAMNHIMAYGDDEGRTFFDPVKYGQENPDVLAAGMDPTAHWFQFGNKEGRKGTQSSVFNQETYNLLNPDVAKAGVDPLQHWLEYGQKENRMGGAFESGLMYDQFNGSTYRDPWIASIPEARRTAETVNMVKALSQKYGWDPAAYAAVVQMETKDSPQELWNPTAHNKLGYWGLSQMGEDSFLDQKDGKLGGMTWQQYQKATPAQQVAMYSAWLEKYARNNPGSAADLVKGGIGSLPPEMQAAIMMGTQFGPNKKDWVQALGEGNMNVPTSTKQAPELAPWTIEAMRDAMAAQMAKWPQQQSPWPLN
jgi:hypothetical protein